MASKIFRPLGFTELFDEVFDLYKKHFLLLVGVATVVQLPFAFAFYALRHVSFMFSMWLWSPINAIQAGAALWAISRCYLEETASVVDSYLAVMRRLFPLIIATFIVNVMMMVGFVLCIIPGIIVLFWTAFVSEVVMLEGMGYYGAIERSRSLVKDEYGRVFLVALIAIIASTLIAWLVQMPYQWFVHHTFRLFVKSTGLLDRVVAALAESISYPVCTTATVLLYYDIRVRKEGFDIEMLARGMSASNMEDVSPKP